MHWRLLDFEFLLFFLFNYLASIFFTLNKVLQLNSILSEDGVICEMKTRTIGCVKDEKRVIAITWANYGRTSSTLCEHPFGTEKLHSDTNCRAVDSISVVRNLCHAKTECTITVDNNLFKKDPCFGVYKYLEVEFECVSPGKKVMFKSNIVKLVLCCQILKNVFIYKIYYVSNNMEKNQ